MVHINAGIAGLVACIMIGKRLGYGREAMSPYNLTLTMIGASVLWVGWMGFNGGSGLAANERAVMAMIVTQIAAAAAGCAWMACEWIARGKPSLLGMLSGAVGGLVVITPASGFVEPMPALVMGLIGGCVCFWGATSLKRALGYDDSLDAFGVHGVGGIVGALLTGVFATSAVTGSHATGRTSRLIRFQPSDYLYSPFPLPRGCVLQNALAAGKGFFMPEGDRRKSGRHKNGGALPRRQVDPGLSATICKSLQIRSCRRLFQSNLQSGKTAAAGICSNATAVSEHQASAL